MNKSYCFAYYANGEWVGWYGGTFAALSKSPKLYSNLDGVRPVIIENFSNKMKKINETSYDEEKTKVSGYAALSLLTFSGEDVLRGKDVELRVVECPEYDGPNLDFDKDAFLKSTNERRDMFNEFLIANGISPDSGYSQKRVELYDEFEKINGKIPCNNWIYADYSKVKVWAENEPTQFIETIKPK